MKQGFTMQELDIVEEKIKKVLSEGNDALVRAYSNAVITNNMAPDYGVGSLGEYYEFRLKEEILAKMATGEIAGGNIND